MSRFDKSEAIRKIIESAGKYENNLKNKNLLFVYYVKSDQRFRVMETRFLDVNFYHLTGVNFQIIHDAETSTKEQKTKQPKEQVAKVFYDACLSHRLSPKSIEIRKDGTTEMKLEVLSNLMNISHNARMLGEYDPVKLNLYTEKLAGGVSGCLGFVKEPNTGYYVPNTALNIDIREVSKRPQSKIVSVLHKAISEEKYGVIDYLAKGFTIEELLSIERLDRISEIQV